VQGAGVSVAEELLRALLADLPPVPVCELDQIVHGRPAEPAPVPDTWDTWEGWGELEALREVDADPPSASGWAVPGVSSSSAPAPPASGTSEPGPEVAALLAALDAVLAQAPGALPGPQALARARALLQAGERLKAAALDALADVEERQLHALDDAPTVHAWVEGLAVPGVDAREVTLARRLRRVPQVAEELRAGRMSTRTAAALTTAVAKARPFLDRPDGLVDGLDGEQALEGVLVRGVVSLVAEQVGGADDAETRLAALTAELTALHDPARSQLERWEAGLVVFARECDPALLASGIGLLVDALLPAEHEKRARQAEDDRGFSLHRKPLGSGWTARGDLDDLTGEMLSVVLDAAEATDPESVDDTRRAAAGQQVLGDDTLPPDAWPVDQPAPRSTRQRRHDALRRGLQALLDSGALGLRGKAVPHVAVTVPLEAVEGVPGSLPARTEHGLRLSRSSARALLCRSAFTRLVLDARHRVVEVSHTQRTSTALERLLLKVQDGAVCSVKACARGPATGHRLIPHHGSLFHLTGTTELADTVLLCGVDHDHHLHGEGRHLTLKDGRVLGPEGWVRP